MSLQPERGISPHEILGPFVLSVPEVQNLLMQIKVWHPLGWVVPEQTNGKIFQKIVSNCHKGLFITFLTYCLLTLVRVPILGSILYYFLTVLSYIYRCRWRAYSAWGLFGLKSVLYSIRTLARLKKYFGLWFYLLRLIMIDFFFARVQGKCFLQQICFYCHLYSK